MNPASDVDDRVLHRLVTLSYNPLCHCLPETLLKEAVQSRVHKHIYPTVTDISFLTRVQADSFHPMCGSLSKLTFAFGATAFMYPNWLLYIQICIAISLSCCSISCLGRGGGGAYCPSAMLRPCWLPQRHERLQCVHLDIHCC